MERLCVTEVVREDDTVADQLKDAFAVGVPVPLPDTVTETDPLRDNVRVGVCVPDPEFVSVDTAVRDNV